MTNRMYWTEIPADGIDHAVALPSDILDVTAQRAQAVKIWWLADPDDPEAPAATIWNLRLFPQSTTVIPAGYVHLRSIVMPTVNLVSHLFYNTTIPEGAVE